MLTYKTCFSQLRATCSEPHLTWDGACCIRLANQSVYIDWFHEQKISGKSNSPSLSITILSYLNILQHSHLTTTALTTAHPKIPQTVMKQDVNPELLYCPLPLPVSFSFPLVSSWAFVHCSLEQELRGTRTISHRDLQRRHWELATTAKITGEIFFLFKGIK